MKQSKSDSSLAAGPTGTVHSTLPALVRLIARSVQIVLAIVTLSILQAQNNLMFLHLFVALPAILLAPLAFPLYLWPKYMKKSARYALVRETSIDAIMVLLWMVVFGVSLSIGCSSNCGNYIFNIIIDVAHIVFWGWSLLLDYQGYRTFTRGGFDARSMSNIELRQATRK